MAMHGKPKLSKARQGTATKSDGRRVVAVEIVSNLYVEYKVKRGEPAAQALRW